LATENSVIHGTLDLLILKLLSLAPMHGWGITEWIENRSAEAIRVPQGSLYASLHRMTREGYIRSYWEATEAGRRARFYAITATGRRQLGRETEHWSRLAAGVGRILSATTT
jgi:PadR family transcriptional regulator PadR